MPFMSQSSKAAQQRERVSNAEPWDESPVGKPARGLIHGVTTKTASMLCSPDRQEASNVTSYNREGRRGGAGGDVGSPRLQSRERPRQRNVAASAGQGLTYTLQLARGRGLTQRKFAKEFQIRPMLP